MKQSNANVIIKNIGSNILSGLIKSNKKYNNHVIIVNTIGDYFVIDACKFKRIKRKLKWRRTHEGVIQCKSNIVRIYYSKICYLKRMPRKKILKMIIMPEKFKNFSQALKFIVKNKMA